MGTANYKWYSNWKPGTMVPIGIMRSQTPQDSPRTLHAFLYNWSKSLITTWRWPTYRAETCRYKVFLVIIEANIVVFDCKYIHQTPYYCTKNDGDNAHQNYECYFGFKFGDHEKNGFLMYVVSLVLQLCVNGLITKDVLCLLPFPWYGGNQRTIWQIAIFV